MVSNLETNDDGWSLMQQKLKEARKAQERKIANSLYKSGSKKPNLTESYFMKSLKTPPNSLQSQAELTQAELSGQNAVVAKAKQTIDKIFEATAAYPSSPLITPTIFRKTAAQNDPFASATRPLPRIDSPYVSYRDTFRPYPNLESWGIDMSKPHDDIYAYRNIVSPLLPIHTMAHKMRKPYIIVTNPSTTDLDHPGRFSHINPIPYNKPSIQSLADQMERISIINKEKNEAMDDKRVEEKIENAQRVLKLSEAKNDKTKDLFSTQFLEDLEYKPLVELSTAPSNVSRTTNKSKAKAPTSFESTISLIEKEIPKVASRTETKKMRSMFKPYVIDVAEKIFRGEVEEFVKQLVQDTIRESRALTSALEDPIFDSIYETTLNKIITEIATEELASHQKKVHFLQSNEIHKMAKETVVNNLLLDHMIETVVQHSKEPEEDEKTSKLLESMTMDILLHAHNDVTKARDRTLNNYPLRKFHLNSFMNVVLDLLVAELSSSLEDDMRDLDDIEKRFAFK